MIKWTKETKKIQELIFYEKNPRTIDEKNTSQLRNSIETFGLCELIVINQDNTVIGGHQRIRTLEALNYTEADVLVPSRMLEEKEVGKLNLLLNKIDGDWDDDILANQWDFETLIDCGFDLDDLGISPQEKKKTQKKVKLTIEFYNQDDLQEALPKLQPIMDTLHNCKYKVSM